MTPAGNADADVDTVADELYGLPPEEFTAARNACVKQARADGDRQRADRIGSLRKPTTAAWLVNQLVRSRADEVDLLFDLGRELRDVMADIEGDELRELTKQRYQLVSALVEQARSLGQSRGRRVTDEVAQAVRGTLEATLSDAESADAVATGRLADALEVSGFSIGRTDEPTSRTSGRRPPPAAGTVTDLGDARRRHERQQAERDVEAAEKAAERARVVGERAEERLQSATREREAVAATVNRIRQELARAIEGGQRAEEQEREARVDVENAQRRARESDDELAQARVRLERLVT